VNPSGSILAIDQSTSSTKVMLFLPDGTIRDRVNFEHTQIYPQAGWVEHDAEEIFNNVLNASSELLKRNPDKADTLLALSITNQRETFVIFDRDSGKPLHHAIVWQCRRGDECCKRLISNGLSEKVHNMTGLKIDTYFPASKLNWLVSKHPELGKKLKDGTALFGTIDTYLIYRLTEGKVYATDHTNASRTLFYNINKFRWSSELCDIFDLEFAELPEIRESSAWFGDTDLGGLLRRRVPIWGVIGDSQSALFAQKCFSPGDTKVTFGTGSSILLNIGGDIALSDKGSITALAWVLQNKPTYAFEGIINFTGATITWLRDQLQIINDPAETEQIATSVDSSDGVYLIPAFVGLSAPYWRADARAAILGMTPSTTRAHIVRAALESIGYIVTDVLMAMGKEADVKLNVIHADGGAVRNNFLMQFFADMNQIEVHAAQSPELSALGAVFMGCLGLKIYSSLSELQGISSDFTVFRPVMDSNHAKDLFREWKAAVQQVLKN